MSRHCSRHPRGFTLVELLVVIGIIALLISILLPALNAARRSATNVACQSNMRQVGLAFQLYANSFGGVAPPTAVWGQRFTMGNDTEAYLGGLLHWWQILQVNDYLPGWDNPERSPLVCPASSDRRGRGYPYPWDDRVRQLAVTSYGINMYMSKVGDGPTCWYRGHKLPKFTRVKNSSEKILMAETVNDADWPGYFILEWWPNRPHPQWGAGPHNWDWARHSKKGDPYQWGQPYGQSNVLWVDGHVTSVRQGTSDNDINADICSSESWWVNADVAAKGTRQWKN